MLILLNTNKEIKFKGNVQSYVFVGVVAGTLMIVVKGGKIWVDFLE